MSDMDLLAYGLSSAIAFGILGAIVYLALCKVFAGKEKK